MNHCRWFLLYESDRGLEFAKCYWTVSSVVEANDVFGQEKNEKKIRAQNKADKTDFLWSKMEWSLGLIDMYSITWKVVLDS